MIRLGKKVAAGASFIQTQAVFDVEIFQRWLEAAGEEGITQKTAILAGVLPLRSAAQGQKLLDTHTDFHIPPDVIDRIKAAGDPEAQQKEGLKVAIEITKELQALPGLRGIHILSGGNEAIVPELLASIST
jgi:methylenetetrahydrofolate reductase (NADPH)